ncbi:MHS family MFS transporter [Rhodococcus sp. ARC_M8]|uniref:MFS transporter n=1 Tax=Rhodococcus sp. ARC_M8 TaxID=2928853 RepID=UPI001FB379AF|nr:MFS transporter [Rhodococcus sp. ARC_M8]MCJ0949988.1 MHS family MFS transporter [Rhodococcus sp. ARC_M8]
MSSDTQQQTNETGSLRRVAIASCTGTTIEFYDFFIYGTAAALVFPTVFFPALGAAAGSVASFATFAVAFVARPLGALIFGHYGDRLGRKKTLVATLLLMGLATIAIGLLPSASTIGVAAPIALIALRLLQGLAVGGEWAGATLLAAEYAPPKQRGLYGIFPQLGPAIAFVMSSGTFLLVNSVVGETSDAFLSWGWRVPFLASALLVLVGLYVRVKVEETPVFKRQHESQAKSSGSKVTEVFWKQPRELFLAAGALAMMFAFFYIGTAYFTSYATKEMGLSRAASLSLGIPAAVVFGLAIALSGIYSDRFGRRRLLIWSCIASIPWSFVVFPILDTNTNLAFFIGLTGTLGIMGVSYGPVGSLLPEMFATRYRYTGAGMAYALAAVIGGGTAPIIASKLASGYGSSAIGWMLAGFGLLSLLCSLAMPETKQRSMESENNPKEETASELT